MKHMRLIRREGETKAHIRGRLRGRSLCDRVMPGAVEAKPLGVPVGDICADCLVRYMGRKK